MMLQPVRKLGDLGNGSVLVFGGPYSNLAATRAMLNEATDRGLGAARIICTGDLVAYCAEPEEVCRVMIDAGIETVMGNCEESLASDSPDCGCGFEEGMQCSTLSARWYAYAGRRVSRGSRDWMSSLPRILRFDMGGLRFAVVHGSADRINRFVFASSPEEIKRRQIELVDADVVIGGHCGIPFGQQIATRYWLNAGVIGLPANDGQPGGWYLLLETASGGVRASWRRLDYDARDSHRAMLEAGLQEYAGTLLNGLWPSMDVLPRREREQVGRPLQLPAMHLCPPA